MIHVFGVYLMLKRHNPRFLCVVILAPPRIDIDRHMTMTKARKEHAKDFSLSVAPQLP